MNQQVNRSYASRFAEEPSKDGSIQFTAITEASTVDGSSKRSSEKSDFSSLQPTWESQEVVFLDESFCQSDCSKLTSEQGSSRYTDHDSSYFNESDRSKSNTEHTGSSRNGKGTQDIKYEDSFCHQSEKDIWWADESSESEDESAKLKDDNYFIPISGRGRSMVKDITPNRGRSLDVYHKKTHDIHRVSRRSSDASNMIDLVSDGKNQRKNFAGSSKVYSSHDKRRSSKVDSNHSHRDGRHHRKSSSDHSDAQRNFARPKCSPRDVEAQSPSAIVQTEFLVDVNKRHGPRQRSLEREHRRRSSSIHKYDHLNERKATGRKFHNLSESEHEIYEQAGKPQRRKGVGNQKSVHPLTARLLAERAIARQNPTGKQLHHSDERQRHQDTNPKHQEHPNHCSVGKHHNLHPLTARLSEGRNYSQQNGRNEPRRSDTQQSYPEAPAGRPSLSKMLSSKVLRQSNSGEHCDEDWRPNLERHRSCPESPSRRAKTSQNLFSQNAASSERIQGSSQIDERRRRLEKQNSCPESPIRRPKVSQQGLQSSSMRQMERRQSGTDLKGSRTSHGGPHNSKDNRYGPVSSYFTPRDPTPIREFSDQLMIGENPDDSAFWHIEPDAFTSLSDPSIQRNEEQKSKRGPCDMHRFL